MPPAHSPPAPAALLTQRCSWPWERCLETLGYPWAAAASGPGRPEWSRRSSGPSSSQPLRGSGSPWVTRTAQLGHSRKKGLGAGGRTAPRPPACHRRRLRTRDHGLLSSRERARQCALEPPGREAVAAPARVDQAGARVPIPATWSVPGFRLLRSATLGCRTCHGPSVLVLTRESQSFPTPTATHHTTPHQRAVLLGKQKAN